MTPVQLYVQLASQGTDAYTLQVTPWRNRTCQLLRSSIQHPPRGAGHMARRQSGSTEHKSRFQSAERQLC